MPLVPLEFVFKILETEMIVSWLVFVFPSFSGVSLTILASVKSPCSNRLDLSIMIDNSFYVRVVCFQKVFDLSFAYDPFLFA